MLPSDVENLWRVELEIDARGSGERGSIRAALPDSDAQQEIFDERQTNDRLVFTIRTDKDQRTGVWSGRFDGLHNLSHGFRVQLADEPLPMPTQLQKEPPKEIVGAVHCARAAASRRTRPRCGSCSRAWRRRRRPTRSGRCAACSPT